MASERKRKRVISPGTEAFYDRMLVRAFGSAAPPFGAIPDAVLTWPESCRAILRAAVKRRYSDAGIPEQAMDRALADIPSEWAPRRVVAVPSETEAQAYEAEARQLPPGRRAMALLPLAMGLRAAEAIGLSRASVQRAARHGELIVLRKGGEEQALPAKHAAPLFEELLEHPIAKERSSLLESPLQPRRTRAWGFTREIFTRAKPIVAYHALHDLVRDVGHRAGIEGLRPHKLRHSFATRMMRDGAPIPVIQFMLGHANIQTTMIYTHPQAQDAEKYLREFT